MAILNSYEIFRMHNSAERYFWACYQLFVGLSSIIGDSLILVASRRKDSFKLNNFLVTIMRHIAACDITISITHILPSALTLVADSWVLGDILCYANTYFIHYFYPANMSLICILTTSKLLLLTRPLRARSLSRKKGHLVCCIMWATSLVYPVLMYVFGREDVTFDYRTYICEYGWNANPWRKIQPVIFVVGGVVPNAVVILTTVPTLKYLVAARESAKRTRGSVPWQGALTVTLTAAVYCLSTLPVTVYYVGIVFIEMESNSATEDPYHFHQLYRYGFFIVMINITSNFFIYTLTITSFRRYLLSKIVHISAYHRYSSR